MIVNLNLRGKNVIIVGGGNEAVKRIEMMAGEQCKITVMSEVTSPKIDKMANDGKINLERQKIQDLGFFARYKPDLVITTTDDHELNQAIVSHAKKKHVLVYSSDSPESSDYANLAVIDVENTVQVAVFTGGKSPAMAKKLKAHIGRNINEVVSSEDINLIKIQETARMQAKEKIHSQKDRKAFLADVMTDKRIKQLIKDGMLKKAENRAIAMLRDWR